MAILTRLSKIVTVEPTILLFSTAYFMYFTTFQDAIYTRVCYERFQDLIFCRDNKTAKQDDFVQTLSSRWMLYVSLVYLPPACLGSLYAGSWGDKLGRKVPLLIPLTTFFITAIGCILWSMNIKTAPYWILLIIKFFSGISGGEHSITAACVSYIAETSTSENRILRLSILEGHLLVGASLGPLLSGIVTSQYGHSLTFTMVAIIVLLAIFYTWVSVENIRRSDKITLKSLFSLTHFLKALETVFKRRKNPKDRRYILLCLLVFATICISLGIDVSLLYLYLKDSPLYWSYKQFTTFLSIRSVAQGISLFIILPAMKYYLKIRDSIIGIIGIICAMGYFLTIGLSTSSITIYLALSAAGFRVFGNVAMRSIISKLVEPDEEGRIFSIVSIFQFLTLFLSMSVGQALWPTTRKIFKGLFFELANVYLFIGLLALIKIHFRRDNKASCDKMSNEHSETDRLLK